MSGSSDTKGAIPSAILVPDEEIRLTIDKTAAYVLKNGDTFEARLKGNNDAHTKFPFLFNDDLNYDYYQWKLGRYTPKTKENGTYKPEIEEKPLELQFLVDLPSISSFDLHVIKLTAMFVARNGDEYGDKLYKHEVLRGNKVQFDFMNKDHSLNDLYQTFIKQYKLTIDILEGTVDFPDLFEDSYLRAKYDKKNKIKKENDLKEQQERKLAYASIDWQDHIIVGKLQFDDIDKVTELAIPLSREELIYRSLESKSREIQLTKVKMEPQKQEEPIEDKKSAESEVQIEPGLPKGMKIKQAGHTRLKKKSQEPMIKCPLTGRMIPELKFDEHIKILLRDSNYDQQKQNYINKNFKFASNLTNDEVYENIKRLSRKRLSTVETEPNKIAKN